MSVEQDCYLFNNVPKAERNRFQLYSTMDPQPYQLFAEETYRAVASGKLLNQKVVGNAVGMSAIVHVHSALQLDQLISSMTPGPNAPSQWQSLEEERHHYTQQLSDQLTLAAMAVDVEIAQESDADFMPLVNTYLDQLLEVAQCERAYMAEKGEDTDEIDLNTWRIALTQHVYFGEDTQQDNLIAMLEAEGLF